MASTFKIFQSGKAPSIRPQTKITNNMQNPSQNSIHNFIFYFNNGTKMYTNGGGGFSYGVYRTSIVQGIESMDDFPLTITSYNINGKTNGANYNVNIPSYTYADYQQGKVLEITINSYIYP